MSMDLGFPNLKGGVEAWTFPRVIPQRQWLDSCPLGLLPGNSGGVTFPRSQEQLRHPWAVPPV